MRYPPQHKTEVRRKILKDASRRVRGEGFSGAAVATVMRDTGLTHGGFYKYFDSKDELLLQSLHEAFCDISAKLLRAAEQVGSEEAWKAMVTTYLSLEYCDHPERGCPLTALAPDMARTGKKMKKQIAAELLQYKDRMVPLMPGDRTADKERAFFAIFSTMIGAVQIARLLPNPAAQQKVLENARDFLFRSLG